MLAIIGKRPMAQRVSVVATDSEEVASGVRSFGGQVAITRSDHAPGTDRVVEVAERYTVMDAVVNIQGDQSFVTPEASGAITPSATPLERCAGLEQLRVLEHGYIITGYQTPKAVIEVNTPEDLQQAQAFVAQGVHQ